MTPTPEIDIGQLAADVADLRELTTWLASEKLNGHRSEPEGHLRNVLNRLMQPRETVALTTSDQATMHRALKRSVTMLGDASAPSAPFQPSAAQLMEMERRLCKALMMGPGLHRRTMAAACEAFAVVAEMLRGETAPQDSAWQPAAPSPSISAELIARARELDYNNKGGPQWGEMRALVRDLVAIGDKL